MSSVGKKQAKFIRAAANNPEFAKKVAVPQKVGKDFADADEAKARAKLPSKARKSMYGDKK